jgi:hypothetical protein
MKHKLLVLAGTVVASAAVAGTAVAASAPTAKTGSATQVKPNSALLSGTVNPNGASTTYYFQIGLTNSYGAATAPVSAGAGVKAKGVSRPVGALVQGTTYHYRLVATNQFGTTVGADRAFKTTGHAPPGAVTGGAVRLATTGATLTGAVFTGSESTTWYFQWGTSTVYGQNTTAQKLAPSTTAQLAVSPLYLLTPGTIYHYRLVASHPGSAITYGGDASFMTFPSPRPTPSVHARTSPGRARHRPYVLTTTGSVTGPSSIPDQYACNGNVTIRFFRGMRQVGFTLAGIQPNCTFAARTVFQGTPGGRPGGPRHHAPVHLHVVVRSIANSYLAGNRAAYESVTLG